ncbi:preprotein translocase subunit SecE [Candidatus Solincola tengchongensis]|uniref:preprotein translocase subunit SecE n=1 Tax=Candidatus Solincola tengchongensis TaxID=2900693 RepID=UPI00257E5C25|nr:preprotein translocase subunit SecE [Candidatus Solincola tengchongensis]
MPSRELRRMQQKLGVEKKRAQLRKSAGTRKKGGPKKQRVTVSQFLTEVRAEMKKVTWPTRDEVVSYTLVVLVTVVLMGGLVYFADILFTKLVEIFIL